MTTHWTEGGATLSECGTYRYSLDRVWDLSLPSLCWVMLNPSTADGREDDPTIRKCMGFADRWGYGSIVVVNLFAYRATKPADLWAARRAGVDIIGPDNRVAIMDARLMSSSVAVAWGRLPRPAVTVSEVVLSRILPRPICIGVNGDGSPKHPVMAGYCMPMVYP